MTLNATIISTKRLVAKLDDDLKFHFHHLPDITDKLGHIPAIALAYCFSQIEAGYRRLLYAGLVRKHRLDPDLSWTFVAAHNVTRTNLPALYKAIFDHDFPASLTTSIKAAEQIRDRMIHGKEPTTKEMWGAVNRCLEYAEALNLHTKSKENFPAFGRLGGALSKKGSPTLPKPVSKLALLGVGLKETL